MGERKVLNKYIPADFDPSLIPRGKKLSSKDGTVPVRMMLPFSIQCSNCSTFLYRGRKFNSKKEAMGGLNGTYLGITRWRFYIKCTHCSRPITILTDPKNADYEMESGGTRNYEIHRDKAETEKADINEEQQTAEIDPIAALENRVLESQKEMAVLDQLEEIKAMNARHVKLLSNKNYHTDEQALLAITRRKQQQDDDDDDTNTKDKVGEDDLLTAEDEKLIQSIQFGRQRNGSSSNINNATIIRRLDEEDEEQWEEQRKKDAAKLEEQMMMRQQQQITSTSSTTVKKPSISGVAGIIQVVKKRKRINVIEKEEKLDQPLPDENNGYPNDKVNNNTMISTKATQVVDDETERNQKVGNNNVNTNGLSGLLGGYGSSSNSDNDSD